MRISNAHKGALTTRGYEHTVETIPLDPVAIRRLDSGFRAILDRLSPHLTVDVRRAVRWTTVLRTYVRYLREHHRMTYGAIADHLNFAYGVELFSEESLWSSFSEERRRQRKTVKCGQSATGSSKMRLYFCHP
jgi:hypothetical protein